MKGRGFEYRSGLSGFSLQKGELNWLSDNCCTCNLHGSLSKFPGTKTSQSAWHAAQRFIAEYAIILLYYIILSEIHSAQRHALHLFQVILEEERLHINSLLRGLLRERIFTKTLRFEIMKQPRADRLRKLIQILEHRGERAFDVFCSVLKTEGAVEVSYHLQKEAYRREPEVYFWKRCF